MARRSKFTEETRNRILDAIRLGATYEKAAANGGVAYNTFNEWRKKGEQAKSGQYHEFYEAIKEAETAIVMNCLRRIEGAAKDGKWQAAAWLLERRYPEVYGRRVVDNHISGSSDKPLEIKIVYDDGNSAS